MEAGRKWSMRGGRLVLAALLFCVLAPAQAGTEMEFKVAAVLRKHASLRVLAQPGSVQVTSADIARGYVEVAAPVQVAVQSNTQDGYMLVFDNSGEFVRHARVRGLSGEVQVGAAGGTVVQRAPGPGMSRVTLTLAFRFELEQGAREGIYPWPVQLSAQPL